MKLLQRFLSRFWPRSPKGGAIVVTTVYWGGVRQPVAGLPSLQCLSFAPCSGVVEEENRMDRYQEYREQAAEARACGDRDFPSFSEWQKSAREVREDAEFRVKAREEQEGY